jgi:hypothetical protein
MLLKILQKTIWQTFLWVALLGGVMGLLMGIALIFRSSLVARVSARMNVWISSRQAMRPLEAPIDIERAVYRWHRLVGALLLAGALFTLYVATTRFQGPELSLVLGKFFRVEIAKWIGQSLRIFLIVANLAALLFAAVMILRPSALKPLEAWANRQYSGRQATRAWEIPRNLIDPFVQNNPRLVGVLLALASLCVLVVLGYAKFLAHLV